jgi:hypothetical protein
MSKTFVVVSAALALALGAVSLLMAQPAAAGASASAPSKYSSNRQAVATHQVRQPQRTDFAITEFSSSSSSKTSVPKR